MKILSLDTSMAACSAAIIDTERPQSLAATYVAMERGHAEALPPMVDEVVKRAGISFSQLDRIAVTTGPGTFTGLRIGLSLARGLGLALHVPVLGIDSLSAIAANEARATPLLVATDARNGEIYAAVFDSTLSLVTAPHVTTALAAATLLPRGGLVLGNAARAVCEASGRDDIMLSAAEPLPVAACFGRIAASMQAGAMPGPLYLRAPDAKPQAAPLRRLGPLTLSPVGPAGADVLSALHREIFEEGWSAVSMSELLSTPGAEALVALDGGEPVGLLITRMAADEAEVITIGTRPMLQRRGVARQLLTHQLRALTARGVREVFLEVADSNLSAQGLYKSLGFHEAGRRKAYYRRSEGTEDAIVMRRELRP